jgi:molybdenum cofactor cytidylyltransferase
MTPCAVVPAAGRSQRFGSPKLLADMNGVPLIARTVGALLDAGLTRVIVVSAPIGGLTSVPLLADPRVEVVVNPDPSRGMFSSIQAGIAVAADAGSDPILVLPADMPFVLSTTIRAVLDEAQRTHAIVVPSHDGRRGHPIAVPAAAAHAIHAAAAESTLKDALTRTGIARTELLVDDPGVLRDVDVAGDLGSDRAPSTT